MGHIPGGGPRGLGTFDNSPSTVPNFNKLLEIIAAVGNYRGPMTEDARDDLTGAELYEGLAIYNTDTESLELYSGTGWLVVWRSTWGLPTTWTPVWENVIIGAGSNWGEYELSGGRCRGEAQFALGSGYALNSDPVRLIPPVAPRTPIKNSIPVGRLIIVDSGTGWINGLVMMTAAGRLEIRTAGNPYSGPMNGTGSPIGFSVADMVNVTFDYRV